MEVGASIVGLLSAGASIAIAINDFVTSCNNAPLFAQSILHETLEFSYALEKLQHLVVGPQATSLDQSRTSMIDVNHLSLTLVGCVCTFSQLEKEIQRMKLSGKFGILDRVKWSFIERDVCSIIQRIQNHKMSLMLILTILNGSATEAASSRESLNTHLSRTISYTPSSMPIDDDSSSVTSNSSLSQKLYRHAFESTLFVSRPYIRGRRFDDAQSAFSIATSQRPKGWWSLYTGKSNDSVLSLPVSVTTISGTSLTEIPSICNLSLPVPPDALLNSLPNPFKPGDPGDPPPPRPSGSTDRDRLTPRNDTYHLVSFRPFLLKAARQGLNTTVTMLLDNTADMSIQRTQRHLDDALHVAMAHGHEEVAQILLERGARISIEPTSVSSGAHGKEKKIDDTPPRQTAHMTKLLRVAIVAGEIDNVALQLDNGAAIEDVDHNGNTTLHLALGITRKDNKDKIIKLLLHRGAAADTRNKQGLTPLHLAAKGGHNDAMKLLLDRGAAIDARAPGEMTALHLAAEYGDKKPAELLLDRGAAIDARTDARLSKTTALHLAAGRGHKNLVELLLDRGADIDAIDNQHNTALHRAQAGGKRDVIELLLDRGSAIEARNEDKLTPLHLAAKHGSRNTIELLLDRGAAIDARAFGEMGALHLAAEHGHEMPANLLLDRGAAIDAITLGQTTALHLAAGHGHKNLVELLLNRGADINAVDNQHNTALHLAQVRGKRDVVEVLLDRGSKIDARNRYELTPLHLAAKHGSKNTIELLLDRGAVIDAKDNQHNMALHLAVQVKGNRDIAELLLDRGAEIEAKNENGDTPLWLAVVAAEKATVQLLLDRGAAIEVTNEDGYTPLHIATLDGTMDIVKLLLARGANINARSPTERTPLHFAARFDQEGIAKILLLNGADVSAKDNAGNTPLDLATSSSGTLKQLLLRRTRRGLVKSHRKNAHG